MRELRSFLARSWTVDAKSAARRDPVAEAVYSRLLARSLGDLARRCSPRAGLPPRPCASARSCAPPVVQPSHYSSTDRSVPSCWRPLSLSRSWADHLATVWDRKWGRAPLALCASRNFTTAGALIAGSCAIPEGCGCNFSPPWKRWNGWKMPRICLKGFFQWKWNVRDLEVSRIEFDRKRSSRISWKNSLGIFHFWISLIIVISIGTFTAKVFVWNENSLEILKFLLLTHAYNVRIFTVVSHVITFYTRMIRLLLLYHTFFIPV